MLSALAPIADTRDGVPDFRLVPILLQKAADERHKLWLGGEPWLPL